MKIGTQLTADARTKDQSSSFRRLRILLLPILLTVGLCGGTIWYIIYTYKAFEDIQTGDLQAIDLSNKIVYLDEVLTSSSLLSTTTGDKQWEKRYLDNAPKLDELVAEMNKLLPLVGITESNNIDDANKKLVALEEQAFTLVNQGKLKEANALLSSAEYKQQKNIYLEGIQTIQKEVKDHIDREIKAESRLSVSTLVLTLISSLILLATWIFVLRTLNRYIQAINSVERVISSTSTEIAVKVERQETVANEQAGSVSQPLLQWTYWEKLPVVRQCRQKNRQKVLVPPSL